MRLDVAGRRRERELPGRLGRVLLAYLALNHHRAVTRDELIEALWPSGAPGDPAGTLSTLLSGVRRCVGADLLRGRSELRLALPADAQLDVETAAARVGRSRAALGAGDAGAAAAEAEAALDVLERGLLRGVDVPWLDAFRRELEDERLDALELLARAGLAAGEAGIRRSHWASRQIISLAPFRESGYALLMEAQAAQGNAAEALETYERLRRLMRDELGATPSPELRAAHQRLLERTVDAPAGERGAGAAASRGAGARRAPGAGREGRRRRAAAPPARRGRGGRAAVRAADRRARHREDQPRRRDRPRGARARGRGGALRALGRGRADAVPAVRGDDRALLLARAGRGAGGRAAARARGARPAGAGGAPLAAGRARAAERAAGRRALPAVRGRGGGVLAARPPRHARADLRRPAVGRPADAPAAAAPRARRDARAAAVRGHLSRRRGLARGAAGRRDRRPPPRAVPRRRRARRPRPRRDGETDATSTATPRGACAS